MQYDREKYLHHLNEYLTYAGVEIRSDGQMRCPNNSAHKNNDNSFSAKFYENRTTGHQRVQCFGCGFKGDIYDIIGFFNNENDFIKQYEIADDLYGNGKLLQRQNVQSWDNEGKKAEPISVTREFAEKIYTNDKVDKCRSYSKDEIINSGSQNGKWYYTDIENNIIACDIRFEGEEKFNKDGKKYIPKKTPTFWYNGKNLKFTGDVYLIYNLYNSLQNDKPILIHEGAKCAEIGINAFNKIENVSYNKGSNNAGKPDWSVYKNRQVYILQDNDKPGLKAANIIKGKLPHAVILKTIYQHFEVEDIDGADIEQLLEQSSIEEIESFILNYDQSVEDEYLKNKKPQILGIDDNNRVFFIDRFQRLFDVRRNQLQKNNLMVISPLEYWSMNYMSDKGSILWDYATDDILEESCQKEFDSTKVRGRGAWREGKNYIYHDGKTTLGKISGDFMYLRKNKRDIGILGEKAEYEIFKELKEICENISFENSADIVKLLGWSVISPFCGALFWRPALLLTGASGSGKSTVLEKIVLPISHGKHYNAHQTSIAGIRADVGNDSCAICLEEAEASQNAGNFDKNTHRNNLFGIMRASSSDDAPEGVKSNADQQVVKYQMKNMFLFVSITPTISDVADDNRIFKVNFVKPEKKQTKKQWEETEKSLVELLNNENCKKIRAKTWELLPKIIDDSKLIMNSMKYVYNKSSRISAGESILVSTYMNLFRKFEINKENIDKFLSIYYQHIGESEERDESEELLKKIFDEVIEIKVEKNSKKMSIKECLDCLNDNNFEYFHDEIYYDNPEKKEQEKRRIDSIAEKEIKRVLGHYGIAFQRDKTMAVANNNDRIKKITGREDGYNKLFQRHHFFVIQPDGRYDKPCRINNQTQRAIIIDIYKDENKIDDDIENIPF